MAQRQPMTNANFLRTNSGVELFVRDWGAGPPVLLLAGWAMTSDLWGSVMVRLTDIGLRAIAYDRRGHGRSSDPGKVDYDLLADDLAEVMEQMNLTDCTIVAHSGAGGEVLRYITRHGDDRISRVIFVGATLPAITRSASNPDGVDPALLEGTSRALASDLAGWIEANALPFAPGASSRTIDWLTAMVMGCSRRIVVDFQREIVRTDFRPELAAVTVPVTIIQGDRDVSAPPDLCGHRIAALLPSAEFLPYEGVAHGPMVTHADQLAEDIARRCLVGGSTPHNCIREEAALV
jgi:non-heme chloroperoxidase